MYINLLCICIYIYIYMCARPHAICLTSVHVVTCLQFERCALCRHALASTHAHCMSRLSASMPKHETIGRDSLASMTHAGADETHRRSHRETQTSMGNCKLPDYKSPRPFGARSNRIECRDEEFTVAHKQTMRSLQLNFKMMLWLGVEDGEL